MKTAVLLLTFNRLDYLKEVFAAVAKAKPPRLYIASDGPRPEKVGEKEQIDKIRKYLLSHIDWDCEVKTRFLKKNSGGCRYGVSGAVTWFFENEPEGIILEDDCVPDLSFFDYCENLLEKYRDDKRIWHIAGDAPIDINIKESYYFSRLMHCWGWASWADRWQYFSLDMSNYGKKELKNFSEELEVQNFWGRILEKLQRGEIDSWAWPWTFNIVANRGLCINPAHCLVSNIGEQGVHYSSKNSNLNKQVYSLTELKHPKRIKVREKNMKNIWEWLLHKELRRSRIVKYTIFGFIPLLTINEE